MSRSAVQEGFGVGAQGWLWALPASPGRGAGELECGGMGQEQGTAGKALQWCTPLSFFPYIPNPSTFCCSSRGAVWPQSGLEHSLGSGQGWHPCPGPAGKFWLKQTEGALTGEGTVGVQDRDTGHSVGTSSSLGTQQCRDCVLSPCVTVSVWTPMEIVALPSAPFLFLLLTFWLQRRSSSLIFAKPWLADLSLSLCLCLCLSLYVL